MTKHNKRSKVGDMTPESSSDGFSSDNGTVAFGDPFEEMTKRAQQRERKRELARSRYIPKGLNRCREFHTKHGRV